MNYLISKIALTLSPGGGIGRHAGLKILCPQGRTGSSPVWGTIKKSIYFILFFLFSKDIIYILNPEYFPTLI